MAIKIRFCPTEPPTRSPHLSRVWMPTAGCNVIHRGGRNRQLTGGGGSDGGRGGGGGDDSGGADRDSEDCGSDGFDCYIATHAFGRDGGECRGVRDRGGVGRSH